jgi:hypothetical protein
LIAIVVSGVLINMSWFLIGAAIDISTIATYGVGALPLKLQSDTDSYCDKDGSKKTDIKSMQDISKLGNCRPILATHGTMNLSDTFNADAAKWKVYYSYTPASQPTQYYLTCPFKNNHIVKKERDTFVRTFTGG